MIATIGRQVNKVPAWAWCLGIGLSWAACEDIQHHRCADSGGVVVEGNVIDGCKKAAK